VIPHFRAPDGKPSYAREDRPGAMTLTEHAATVKKPELQPRARLDGNGLIETQFAHIPEVIDAANGGEPEKAAEKAG
jgi:hypothetical protein